MQKLFGLRSMVPAKAWVALGILTVTVPAAAVPALGTTWHVNCEAGNASGDAMTLHSLEQVNALLLRPDDTVLFQRGTVCHGFLSPRGSGREGHPIRMGAYGSGTRPRIEAADDDDDDNFAFLLRNQEQWEIESLDIRGGSVFGIHVTAARGVMHHIVLRDLEVSGAGGKDGDLEKKTSGLVVFNATAPMAGFDDILIDGVLAHNTSQWAGIDVEGAKDSKLTRHVVVRNSMVHDVLGDGIVLLSLSDGLVENSVAWHTGMQQMESIGTPNAIWTWNCTRCMVRNNEAFLADSPGYDGGAFDIDFWNVDNAIENNYAHDTQGYCAAVFGAFGVTTRSVIRGNLCIRNGTSPRLAMRQGAMFMTTWEKGSLDGVRIDDNTIYYDPPGNFAVIQRTPYLAVRNIEMSGNRIYSVSKIATAPKLPWEDHDNSLTQVSSLSFGQAAAPAASSLSPAVEALRRMALPQAWSLVVSLPEIAEGKVPSAAVGQLMLLRSQALQYREAGLHVLVACHCTPTEREQIEADWQLGRDGVTLADMPAGAANQETALLIAADGTLKQMWTGTITPSQIGLALRQTLGEPRFAGLPER